MALTIRDTALSNFQYYHYKPSLPAAVIFIVLFAATTLVHTYQMARTRTWFFIPFVIGGCFELIGYAGRAVSSRQTPNWTEAPYVTQALLLLVAPAFFASSIYMCLGRIVHMVDGDRHLFIRRNWMTKIFVAGDVLSFMMQGSGGGLLSTGNPSLINTGSNVIVGGLFVQIIFFGAFVAAAAWFHAKLSRDPTPTSSRLRPETGISWKRQLIALYIASALILVRSVVRVVEYLQGFDGYILRHEVYLYVFDAVLMWAVTFVFNWEHPSQVKSVLRGGPYLKGVKMMDLGVGGEQFHGTGMSSPIAA